MGTVSNSEVAGSKREWVDSRRGALSRLVRSLGPGLITGASDDDPSGIATYSQVGAQFGFTMLWTLVFSYPLMSAIQEVSAWIGRVTGAGITLNLKKKFAPWICTAVVMTLLVANVANLAADIAAMANVLKLSIGGSSCVYAIVFGVICATAEIVIPYKQFARVLMWMTLVLFVYVAAAFATKVPLHGIVGGALLPSIHFSGSYFAALTAVLGTTISPYLFFWQASQEVEEQRQDPSEHPLKLSPQQADAQLQRVRVDTYAGMAVSNTIGFFIILDTAATLHLHGVTDIETATQAATALRPIAGDFAFVLFVLGILGTGLLSIPVLAGSVGYALAELRSWPIGLERPLRAAREFYGAIAAVTALGVALTFTSISAIKALFWSAVLNGVSAGPIMILLMLMTRDMKLTGGLTLPRPQWILGWIATIAMLAVSLGLMLSWLAKAT